MSSNNGPQLSQRMDIMVQQILLALFSILVGGIIGYRFALHNERRKEFNEIADRLFLNVDVKVVAASGHHFAIDRQDVKLIRRRMGFMQRRSFDRALAEFDKVATHTVTDTVGQVYYEDPEGVNRTLAEIAKCLCRK